MYLSRIPHENPQRQARGWGAKGNFICGKCFFAYTSDFLHAYSGNAYL
jgi:hypothetical protein